MLSFCKRPLLLDSLGMQDKKKSLLVPKQSYILVLLEYLLKLIGKANGKHWTGVDRRREKKGAGEDKGREELGEQR